ncbi:MAG: carboxypeptidase-like regulatory domain-containing protein, partial [Cyanobacteria bacterium P01_C01_bin.38]
IPSRGGSFNAFDDGRLSLSLTSDMSVAGGKFTPARYSGISKERGAVAGKLAVKGGSKGFDLSNSIVRIYDTSNKNVGSTKTDSSGNFFLGNLPEGVYVIELEPEELPIELAISKTSLVAEVAASGVTRVDFPVRTEYGVAGKVTDASGQPLEEVRIELVTSTGARVLSGTTDQFGLYRLDGVPVGKYTLRVSSQDELNSNNTLPKRQVVINNKFVYNQNLQLPVSAAAKKKDKK